MQERRRETRCKVDTPAEITPLAAVTQPLSGHVINVSSRGLRVRLAKPLSGHPRAGDVYRVNSSSDRMLCEISHWLSNGDSTDIGFRILHWSDMGQLNRVVEKNAESQAVTQGNRLEELNLPGFKAAR